MDPMCRRVVQRILSDTCDVMTASKYNEILEMLKTHHFDSLFVDNDLPQPGVIQLFREAQEIAPDTKRILMTGENVVNLQHYLKIGLVNAYVTRTTSSTDIEREVTTPPKKIEPVSR
jgi:DNA-binding NtrC family response regulator